MEDRLEVVNKVLAEFAPGTVVKKEGSQGWTVHWTNYRGIEITRRWQVRRGGSFYPVWSKLWAHGGTCCAALTQLMRWLQGRSVLPLSTWRYWKSNGLAISCDSIESLARAGYPDRAVCIHCGEQISNGFDWYDLGKISGCVHFHCCDAIDRH